MDLTGKNVIYFGGFGGIGLKCIEELLKKNLTGLAIFDLAENDDILAEWQNSFPNTEIFYQKVDMTKKSDIEAAYKVANERMEYFDLIVHGSGIMNENLIDLTIEINLLGLIHSSLIALDYMSIAKGGRGGLILNISSVVGLQPEPLFPVYAASKTAVISFTRSLAAPFYYEQFGVAFIAVCPGLTETPIIEDMTSKCMFDFETPLHQIAPKIKRQSAEDCARTMLEAIEEGKNGDVLMLELGKTHDVKIPNICYYIINWLIEMNGKLSVLLVVFSITNSCRLVPPIKVTHMFDSHPLDFGKKRMLGSHQMDLQISKLLIEMRTQHMVFKIEFRAFNMDLTGKNVIYFGGFGGIGQKCIDQLLQKNLKGLAIFDLEENEEILTDWQKCFPSTNVFYQKVDVTRKSNIEAAYKAANERLEYFDLIVNGSGILNEHLIDPTIAINLLGVIHSTLIALEYMSISRGGRGGVILNISSAVGLQPEPLYPICAASKIGVVCFTRSLAAPFYYDQFGVAFITVCPGLTDTSLLDDMTSKSIFHFDTPIHEIVPKIKRQTPEDCAMNIVKAIEEGKSGDVFLLELGESLELNIPSHWVKQLFD